MGGLYIKKGFYPNGTLKEAATRVIGVRVSKRARNSHLIFTIGSISQLHLIIRINILPGLKYD